MSERFIQSFILQEYDVPAGHYLMLSPFWAHRDRDRFPDPHTFNPVRDQLHSGTSYDGHSEF